MGIPESQLQTWSNHGAVTAAKLTHESIRNALTASTSPVRDKSFEPYLQGSYKNNTNIRGDSDVDLVIQINFTFRGNTEALSEYEKTLYEKTYPNATYLWTHFRVDVIKALRVYYEASTVSEGNKSLKVAGDSGRLPADVVVCLQYRKYQSFKNQSDERFIEGIAFYALRENRWVINFPKLHYSNGIDKNAEYRTNGWFKPIVRVFKNGRTYLADRGVISGTIAPSYFLECLLYNVPDGHFGSSYQESFLSVVKWLIDSFSNGYHRNFLSQNGQLPLFGSTPEQWSADNAMKLLRNLIELWQNW